MIVSCLHLGQYRGEVYLDFQPYRPVITAAMPNTTAKPMRKYRTILLKSKKPLPVTVTAPMIAITANTAKITLAILQMFFFIVIPQIISGFILIIPHRYDQFYVNRLLQVFCSKQKERRARGIPHVRRFA